MAGPKRAPIYHADCIELVLTCGYSTFVDLDCPADILGRNWCMRGDGYAVTRVREGSVKSMRTLHRMLLGNVEACMDVDHIDRDPLNNRLNNLRVCTRKQNAVNTGPRKGRFRGVSWDKDRQKWAVQLCHRDAELRRHTKRIGYFDDEEEAARAWDAAALASDLYDPAFLRLNFPQITT